MSEQICKKCGLPIKESYTFADSTPWGMMPHDKCDNCNEEFTQRAAVFSQSLGGLNLAFCTEKCSKEYWSKLK